MMTIREYAEAHHHKVVGKLRRTIPLKDNKDPDGTPYRIYLDEIYNEYTINRNGICITTVDGNVI